LLCGLVSGENYPKELEKRMGISKSATNELVNEMNNSVFRKIQEELIKNIERKKILQKNSPSAPEVGDKDTQVLSSAGIEIVPEKLELQNGNGIENREEIMKKIEKPETIPPVRSRPLENENATVTLGRPASNGIHPIFAQKLSKTSQTPIVKQNIL
jgi:hypothetical protein